MVELKETVLSNGQTEEELIVGGSFGVAMSLPHLLDTRSWSYLSVFPYCSIAFSSSLKFSFPQTVHFPAKLRCVLRGSQSSFAKARDDADEDLVIGDCVVFEEGIFVDPYLKNDSKGDRTVLHKAKGRKKPNEVEPENLVPEQWKEVQAEINLTKNEKRKIAQELEFGSRVEKRKQGYAPLRDVNLEDFKTYREAKLAQLNPVVLDNPSSFPVKEHNEEAGDDGRELLSERVKPKNPRWAVYGRGLEDVADFFNSENYDPDKKSEDKRKLFTREEKFLLNKRLPDLETATSDKWLPLHTLAASGEFDLLDALLKHNVDINAVDQDGLTALHRAIIGKKQAIAEYLLRESADPFVRDEEGASLMHYAVQTASSRAIKILLLYNVDINLQDNDGWTPLHLAVQSRRTDVVRLLLIKGADKTIKNKDGLTALELCLYSGQHVQTYELIKLLKLVPSPCRSGPRQVFSSET